MFDAGLLLSLGAGILHGTMRRFKMPARLGSLSLPVLLRPFAALMICFNCRSDHLCDQITPCIRLGPEELSAPCRPVPDSVMPINVLLLGKSCPLEQSNSILKGDGTLVLSIRWALLMNPVVKTPHHTSMPTHGKKRTEPQAAHRKNWAPPRFPRSANKTCSNLDGTDQGPGCGLRSAFRFLPASLLIWKFPAASLASGISPTPFKPARKVRYVSRCACYLNMIKQAGSDRSNAPLCNPLR